MKTNVTLAVIGALLIGCGSGAPPATEAVADAPLDVMAAEPVAAQPSPRGDEVFTSLWPEGDEPTSPEDASARAAQEAAEAAALLASAKPNVQLRLQNKMGPAYSVITYLIVQSTDDRVTITSVDANRGNCALLTAAGAAPAYPVTLGFGSELWLQPVGCGGMLEAKVHTSAGSFDFSFAEG